MRGECTSPRPVRSPHLRGSSSGCAFRGNVHTNYLISVAGKTVKQRYFAFVQFHANLKKALARNAERLAIPRLPARRLLGGPASDELLRKRCAKLTVYLQGLVKLGLTSDVVYNQLCAFLKVEARPPLPRRVAGGPSQAECSMCGLSVDPDRAVRIDITAPGPEASVSASLQEEKGHDTPKDVAAADEDEVVFCSVECRNFYAAVRDSGKFVASGSGGHKRIVSASDAAAPATHPEPTSRTEESSSGGRRSVGGGSSGGGMLGTLGRFFSRRGSFEIGSSSRRASLDASASLSSALSGHPDREEVVLEGFLWKRGGFRGGRKNWKRRFIVLKGSRLYYYRTSRPVLLGVMPLCSFGELVSAKAGAASPGARMASVPKNRESAVPLADALKSPSGSNPGVVGVPGSMRVLAGRQRGSKGAKKMLAGVYFAGVKRIHSTESEGLGLPGHLAAYLFSVATPERELLLCAETPEERDEWMLALMQLMHDQQLALKQQIRTGTYGKQHKGAGERRASRRARPSLSEWIDNGSPKMGPVSSDAQNETKLGEIVELSQEEGSSVRTDDVSFSVVSIGDGSSSQVSSMGGAGGGVRGSDRGSNATIRGVSRLIGFFERLSGRKKAIASPVPEEVYDVGDDSLLEDEDEDEDFTEASESDATASAGGDVTDPDEKESPEEKFLPAEKSRVVDMSATPKPRTPTGTDSEANVHLSELGEPVSSVEGLEAPLRGADGGRSVPSPASRVSGTRSAETPELTHQGIEISDAEKVTPAAAARVSALRRAGDSDLSSSGATALTTPTAGKSPRSDRTGTPTRRRHTRSKSSDTDEVGIKRSTSRRKTRVGTPGVQRTGSARRVSRHDFVNTDHWRVHEREIEVLQRIGSGKFGDVFKGVLWGTDVAVKLLHAPQMEHDITADLAREINVLAQLRHPNVLLYMGACTTPPNMFVVTEWCERGSLSTLLYDKQSPLSVCARVHFALQVAHGMCYLHSRPEQIIHRDLKSYNLLVTREYVVKVGDFGLTVVRSSTPRSAATAGKSPPSLPGADAAATAVAAADSVDEDTAEYGREVGTPQWMAPEVMESQRYNFKVDLYSFGIVLCELVSRIVPYSDRFRRFDFIDAVLEEGAIPTLPRWIDVAQELEDLRALDAGRRPPISSRRRASTGESAMVDAAAMAAALQSASPGPGVAPSALQATIPKAMNRRSSSIVTRSPAPRSAEQALDGASEADFRAIDKKDEGIAVPAALELQRAMPVTVPPQTSRAASGTPGGFPPRAPQTPARGGAGVTDEPRPARGTEESAFETPQRPRVGSTAIDSAASRPGRADDDDEDGAHVLGGIREWDIEVGDCTGVMRYAIGATLNRDPASRPRFLDLVNLLTNMLDQPAVRLFMQLELPRLREALAYGPEHDTIIACREIRHICTQAMLDAQDGEAAARDTAMTMLSRGSHPLWPIADKATIVKAAPQLFAGLAALLRRQDVVICQQLRVPFCLGGDPLAPTIAAVPNIPKSVPEFIRKRMLAKAEAAGPSHADTLQSALKVIVPALRAVTALFRAVSVGDGSLTSLLSVQATSRFVQALVHLLCGANDEPGNDGSDLVDLKPPEVAAVMSSLKTVWERCPAVRGHVRAILRQTCESPVLRGQSSHCAVVLRRLRRWIPDLAHDARSLECDSEVHKDGADRVPDHGGESGPAGGLPVKSASSVPLGSSEAVDGSAPDAVESSLDKAFDAAAAPPSAAAIPAPDPAEQLAREERAAQEQRVRAQRQRILDLEQMLADAHAGLLAEEGESGMP